MSNREQRLIDEDLWGGPAIYTYTDEGTPICLMDHPEGMLCDWNPNEDQFRHLDLQDRLAYIEVVLKDIQEMIKDLDARTMGMVKLGPGQIHIGPDTTDTMLDMLSRASTKAADESNTTYAVALEAQNIGKKVIEDGS